MYLLFLEINGWFDFSSKSTTLSLVLPRDIFLLYQIPVWSGPLCLILSINFNNDLEDFRKIDPCGLHRREISSLKELKVSYNKNKITKELKESFTKKFDLNLI